MRGCVNATIPRHERAEISSTRSRWGKAREPPGVKFQRLVLSSSRVDWPAQPSLDLAQNYFSRISWIVSIVLLPPLPVAILAFIGITLGRLATSSFASVAVAFMRANYCYHKIESAISSAGGRFRPLPATCGASTPRSGDGRSMDEHGLRLFPLPGPD